MSPIHYDSALEQIDHFFGGRGFTPHRMVGDDVRTQNRILKAAMNLFYTKETKEKKNLCKG
jgi:hypothetical protein